MTGLLLAAGRSRRMGRPKPLLLYRGEPFAARICRLMLDAGLVRVIVVLAAPIEPVLAVLPDDPRLSWVENPDPDRGQLSSLQAGLAAAPPGEPVMQALVDHPAVALETYRGLVAAHARGGGAIYIPTFGGRRGHPVVWDAAVLPELLAAPPDQGARVVVRADPSRVLELAVEDPGILVDVDRPDDYAAL